MLTVHPVVARRKESTVRWKWDIFLTLFFIKLLQNTDIRIVQLSQAYSNYEIVTSRHTSSIIYWMKFDGGHPGAPWAPKKWGGPKLIPLGMVKIFQNPLSPFPDLFSDFGQYKIIYFFFYDFFYIICQVFSRLLKNCWTMKSRILCLGYLSVPHILPICS